MTATIRFVLDNDWKSKSARSARAAAIDGISGIEYDLVTGTRGDPSLEMHIVYGDGFFMIRARLTRGLQDCRFTSASRNG